MSTANFLHTLAMESDLIPSSTVGELTDTGTVADLIIDDIHAEQPGSMLDHAHKAREIADDLDNLAERADELAEQDERYTGLSVESMGREFNTLMKAHGLMYKAHSFESELGTLSRAKGMARDARSVANDLRTNAHAIEHFSPEGIILDLFKDKDKAIEKAKVVMQRELGAIKGVAGALNEHGVIVNHDGIANFLTQRNTDVRDFKAAVAHDSKYLDGVFAYVNERIAYLSGLGEDATVTPGNEAAVNTSTKGTVSATLAFTGNPDELPLLGNQGVFDFKLMEKKAARRIGKAFTGKGYGTGLKAGVGVLGSMVAVGAGAFIIVGAITANPAAAAVAAGVGAYGTAIDQAKTQEKAVLNSSDVSTHITTSDLESAVKQILDLTKYANTDAQYKELEKLDVKGIKGAKDEISKVKRALEILKKHTYYLTTETARLMEHVAKHAK